MSGNVVTYYLSVNSPWTFLGGARLHAVAKKYGVSVDVRPVDATKLFPVSGGLPVPKRAPQRQAYRFAELDRWRRFLDIKMILEPQHFPAPERIPSGMVVAAQSMGGDALALATAFGHALWVDDQDFSQRDVQLRVAESLGFDGAQLIDAATSTETLEALDGCTQSAIEAQVFGMPTYVFRGELFWGQDRLDFLERAIQAVV